MATQAFSSADIRWDLGDLFASVDDPKIEISLRDALAQAQAFALKYRNTINVSGGPPPAHLLAAIQESEALQQDFKRLTTFADLLYAADTSHPGHRNLREKAELSATEISNHILFFELEWMQLTDEDADRLSVHPSLAGYRHYLRRVRTYRPHRLSEPEERLVNERDNTGRHAFARLFTELVSGLRFPLQRDGRSEMLTMSEILALAHHHQREIRQRAFESLFDILSKHELVLTSVHETLIQDHLTMDRLRRFPHPMAERHLDNEIDDQAVEQMMTVAEANYGIAQEYFRLKARLLGLPKLELFDQYAPLNDTLPICSFNRSQQMVLEAFSAFSPRLGALAHEFFARRWIDAEVRAGKRGGAFCASPAPALHPYVLLNYTDNLRDMMTLAHELGHAMHGCLARKQTLFNYDPPLTMAETASVFGEFLVFEHLTRTEKDPQVQLALICGKIEDTCATVFRQNVLTRFEQAVFEQRRRGRLAPEAICQAWIEANGRYYGDAVELTEGYRWGWSYIPHFIHTRFYCYSYVFGQLLVLSLYRQYKEEGAAFVPHYIRLLEAGASDSPEALLKPLGVDFHDQAFWQRGFDEIRNLVERAQELALQKT
jgi:oligoendopeptidase F